MSYDPIGIFPYKSGLIQYYKPFVIGNDAFTTLDNAYSFRGVVKKREGSNILARVAAWTTITTITTGSTTIITKVAHGLFTGDMIWLEGIVSTIIPDLNNKSYLVVKIDADHFSINDLNNNPIVTTGTYTSGGSIFLPIMGTRTYIQSSVGITATSIEELIVFTERRAYLLNTSGIPDTLDNISFDTGSAAILWTGGRYNFFFTSNYYNVLWVTNNFDVIRYFNGSTTAGFQNFQPIVNGTTTLDTCLMILPYKGRLVVLNTVEGGNRFFNRARWAQVGNPFITGTGSDVNAWRDDIIGKGGFTDADTSEPIVGATIIQDTLIVGFQFSTWRLRYTGNDLNPFIWERIDTQFGCESTFSIVPFDNQMLQISRRGIVGASFNEAKRIDMLIPDFVDSFETGNTSTVQGLSIIQGIRDYQKRLVYWIYGDEGPDSQTPNKVLCFNYQDNTWSTFTQSFTVLGSFKKTLLNIWSTWTTPWDGDTSTWDTPLDQTNSIITVAGDQQGNVWQIMNNDRSTDNGTAYNFTITTNWINPYFKKGKRCKLAYYDLYITSTGKGQVTVQNTTDDDEGNIWLSKSVQTNPFQSQANTGNQVLYSRVFLGMIARNHQITITLTPDQLINSDIASSPFELQGIIMHTREEGRIKQ